MDKEETSKSSVPLRPPTPPGQPDLEPPLLSPPFQSASQGGFKPAMSTEDFREWGKKMVDYICDYMDNIGNLRVIPDVEPGYLRPLLPEQAPEEPENWPDILKDVTDYIIPGITHWQHPRFHAYFPAGNSYPSIMGDMLSDAFGTIGFSWAASPAMAELEILVLDWLAGLLGLPTKFTHEGTGGGAMQGSASDCILLSMLAARHHAIAKNRTFFKQANNPNPDTAILSLLVAYCSNLAHSSVEKAGLISFVQVRQLAINDDFSMDPQALEEAICEDIAQGFIPFYVCATLGTTACCSFDHLKEIGPIARKYGLWLHADGAYGANSFICPEFRHHLEGIEHANSFNFNPNKWLLTNFDVSVFWVSDKAALTHSMVVNPVYLQHKYSSKAIDFRHWGIPLSRRFRALKLWFVIRMYGAKGLRAYIRNHVRLAKLFESLVAADEHFEVIGRVELGLVCFRLKGANALTQCLIRAINESRELHVVPAMVNEMYVIRFAVCRESASVDDIQYAWKVIRDIADQIIAAENSLLQWREHTRENSIRKKKRAKAAATALGLVQNAEVKEIDQLPEVPEEENEMEEEDSFYTLDGDLDQTDLGHEEMIQLATERLLDLKEQCAQEAYDLLAQQLRNLGVADVKNYEECNPVQETPEGTPPTEESDQSPLVQQVSETSPILEDSPKTEEQPAQDTSLVEPDADDDLLDELPARMGRFKSVSMGIALRGADRYYKDRHHSQPFINTPYATKNPPLQDSTTPKSQRKPDKCCETPENSDSLLNGTMNLDENHMTSSTPYVEAQARRFSLACTPNTSITGSGGTPVVARLVSMVMNTSGNGSINMTGHGRHHRPSLKSSTILDESTSSNTTATLEQSRAAEASLLNRSSNRKLCPQYSNVSSYRMGVNNNTGITAADDDMDEVFAYDSDLCVGGLSKESTLTRLRRQTLWKMISDPVSYKNNNRRNFRSFREQRRMTTVVDDFEPRERPKSEYIRRPTVQICENINRANEPDSAYLDEFMRAVKPRNKSMFESSSISYSSVSPASQQSDTAINTTSAQKPSAALASARQTIIDNDKNS